MRLVCVVPSFEQPVAVRPCYACDTLVCAMVKDGMNLSCIDVLLINMNCTFRFGIVMELPFGFERQPAGSHP